jgi:hypothetical protein
MLRPEVAMQGIDTMFSRNEWNLLVRLPGQVLIAATSAEPDGARRTVAEGLAGIDAIAAGRKSDNALIRQVVSTIYAERAEDTPAAEEFVDREAGIAAVLAAARVASDVLAERSTPVDRDAYRDWVASIADRVCGASRSGGVAGVGGPMVSDAERRFMADLAAAFHG